MQKHKKLISNIFKFKITYINSQKIKLKLKELSQIIT